MTKGSAWLEECCVAPHGYRATHSHQRRLMLPLKTRAHEAWPPVPGPLGKAVGAWFGISVPEGLLALMCLRKQSLSPG